MTITPACLTKEQDKGEKILSENRKYKVYTIKRHKITSNRNDDKRLAQANGITTILLIHQKRALSSIGNENV